MQRVLVITGAFCLVAGLSCSKNSTQPTVTVTSVLVAPDSLGMRRGDSAQLTASPLDADGHLVSGIVITFASQDQNIATVSATGLVHAAGTGKTAIVVSAAGVTQSVPVTVVTVPFSIEIAPRDTTIATNGTFTLHATVFDATHTAIAGAPITFQSSDSTVATISGTGLVTGKAGGTAALYASSTPALASTSVTVTDTSLVSRTPLSGSPFGTAATKSGTSYVLRHTANSASRFDLPSLTVAATFGVDNNPTVIAFDSSGATAFVTAQFADKVDVITVATNSVTDFINVTGDPFMVRVAPDDKSIWVSTNVDSLYQIDRTTKTVLARYAMPFAVNGLAFSPTNDSLLYASTLVAGKVVEINYKKGTIGRTFSPGGNTQAVAVSPDGTELYVANEYNNEIEIYNLSSGAALTPITTIGGAFDLTLSANGATLWVSESQSGIVQAFDRVSRQLQRTVRTGGAPRRIATTPATTHALVANEAGWVDLIK
jgi:YVTN family beta-propeller protein